MKQEMAVPIRCCDIEGDLHLGRIVHGSFLARVDHLRGIDAKGTLLRGIDFGIYGLHRSFLGITLHSLLPFTVISFLFVFGGQAAMAGNGATPNSMAA